MISSTSQGISIAGSGEVAEGLAEVVVGAPTACTSASSESASESLVCDRLARTRRRSSRI